jgi:Ca2+-binding EF-hand superfamily protein
MNAMFAALTAVTALAAAPALAQPPQGVTLAQFQARRLARVMKADTDHDGRISLAEWMAAHAKGPGDPARQFERLDADHDGFVTPAEIQPMLAKRFARLDANHDGVLSPDEIAAARTARGNEG